MAATARRHYQELTVADEAAVSLDGQPQRPRCTATSALQQNRLPFGALILGLSTTLACFAFTFWLAHQDKPCKRWQFDACTQTSSARWFLASSNTVQSCVSTIDQVGLALAFFPLYCLGETTVWPMLRSQAMALDHLDEYVTAVRGSLWSTIRAVCAPRYLRSSTASIAISCTFVLALLGQANQLIVGQAYSPRVRNETYQSIIHAGGEVTLPYLPVDKGPPIPGAVRGADIIFSSWVGAYSDEPLPELRDFVFNRQNMSRTGGGFNIGAVRVHRAVTCHGFSLNESINEVTESHFTVATTLNESGLTGVGSMKVRLQPRTAIWVDGFQYMNETRTITRLVLAAINGTVEDGKTTEITTPNGVRVNATAVLCQLDITLKDDVIMNGRPSDHFPNITTLDGASASQIRGPHTAPFNSSIANLAAWFGAVPTAFGHFVDSSAPMYAFTSGSSKFLLGLPRTYASTQALTLSGDVWAKEDIKRFLRIASGALGIAVTRNHYQTNQTVSIQVPVTRMLPKWAFLMLIQPSLIVLMTMAFLWLHIQSYQRARITEVRRATVTDILVSSRTLFAIDDTTMNKNFNGKTEVELKNGEKGYGLYPI